MLTGIWEKCKSREAFIVAVICLVAVGSYGLGRLSTIKKARGGVTIESPLENRSSALSSTNFDESAYTTESGVVVASKNGTKYHFPWCAGARSIASVNKVWFNSSSEAVEAGYAPAENCRGLK